MRHTKHMQSTSTPNMSLDTTQMYQTRQSHSRPTKRFHTAHARAPHGDLHAQKVRRRARAARREGHDGPQDVQQVVRTSRAVHGTRRPSISVVHRQPSGCAPLSHRARWWREERGIYSRDGVDSAARVGAHLRRVHQNRLYERQSRHPQVCNNLRASS